MTIGDCGQPRIDAVSRAAYRCGQPRGTAGSHKSLRATADGGEWLSLRGKLGYHDIE